MGKIEEKEFWIDIIVRAGKQLIDYYKAFGIKAITSANIPITTKTDNDKILKVKEITELEKSYMVKNEQGQIAFIGKTTIESLDLSNNTLTFKDNFKWILGHKKDGTPNIQWKEDNQ